MPWDYYLACMSEIKNVTLKFSCSENWDGMTPVDGGRMCNKCSKKVIDFAGKTQADVDTAMLENNGNVCGAFSSNTPIKTIGQNVFKWRNAAILAGALQLMLACKPTRYMGGIVIGQNGDTTNIIQMCDSFVVDTRNLVLNPRKDSTLKATLPKITTPYTTLPHLKKKFFNPCPNMPLSDVLVYYSDLHLPSNMTYKGNFNITLDVTETGKVKQVNFDVVVPDDVRKAIVKGSKKMKFEPAEKDGKKVPFTMIVPLAIYPTH